MKASTVLIAALAAVAGWAVAHFPGHHGDSIAIASTAHAAPTLRRQCPMHPWIRADAPGTCTLCGMALVSTGPEVTPATTTEGDPVLLPPGTARVAGVTHAEARTRPLVRTVRIAGQIGEDESRHGVISAPVEGRIDGLGMSCEGEKITRRQPLFTIFSRPLLAAANDYKRALAGLSAELEAAKKRLQQFGLVSEQITAIPTRQEDDLYFGIAAPLSGTIVKSYVSEGQYVREGERLFEIADFTRMWFVFTADEQDLPLLRVGQIVELTTSSLPGETLRSRIGFISPNLDEVTRSARVRVVLENPDRRIKNRIFAQGVVRIDAPTVLSIPRRAVLRTGSSPRVYVATGPGRYEARSIALGRMGDTDCEVLTGLKEGDQVAEAGNLLIDSQAQLAAAPAGNGAGGFHKVAAEFCEVKLEP